MFYLVLNFMNCQRPTKNEKTNKWEVWDFAYEDNVKRYYELHEFFEYRCYRVLENKKPKTKIIKY